MVRWGEKVGSLAGAELVTLKWPDWRCVTISAPVWSQNQLACLKGWESKKTVSGFYECFFLEVLLSHTLTKCSVWLFPPSLGKSRDGVREEIRIWTSPASLRLAIVALRPECSVKMTSFGP